MHERQAIRDAVVAQLVGPSPYVRTVAGQRVFKTRTGPVRESDLPCVCVYVEDETVAPQYLMYMQRDAMVKLEGYVKAAPTADLDAAMDDLAYQLEVAWALDYYLGGSVLQSYLSRTKLETAMLGAQPMGRVTLEYSIRYETDNRIGAPVDDFHTVDIYTSIAGAQAPADRAHNSVTLP